LIVAHDITILGKLPHEVLVPWFVDPGHDRLWEQSMGRGTQQFLWLRKTHENILVGGFNHLEK